MTDEEHLHTLFILTTQTLLTDHPSLYLNSQLAIGKILPGHLLWLHLTLYIWFFCWWSILLKCFVCCLHILYKLLCPHIYILSSNGILLYLPLSIAKEWELVLSVLSAARYSSIVIYIRKVFLIIYIAFVYSIKSE